MSAARVSDGLLSHNQTIALFVMLGKRDRGALEGQLLQDFAASHQTSWVRAQNTIVKLKEFGLINTIADGKLVAAPGFRKLEVARSVIRDRCAKELMLLLDKNSGWGCLKLIETSAALTIDNLRLPEMNDGLGVWLMEFEVTKRDHLESRYWRISGDYFKQFLEAASNNNTKPTKRAKSAEKLAQELANQAELGKAAEEWVVAYERKRLKDHPLIDQIRRISDDDVAAGYDIVSFSSGKAISHDHFIEVKSFGRIKRFFWTANEIETAKEFGETYSLYLIDRHRIGEANYVPQIISGPSPEIFAAKNSGWVVSATGYEHVAVSIPLMT